MPSRISKFALNGLEKVNQRLIITYFIGFFDFFTIVIPSGEPSGRTRQISLFWRIKRLFSISPVAWKRISGLGLKPEGVKMK